MRRFLSTPSARRATSLCELLHIGTEISIHALREEGDRGPSVFCRCGHISIHALREEGDASGSIPSIPCSYFYPRPPRGGRPQLSHHSPSMTANFYPRPPRGGRPFSNASIFSNDLISIHALREEGDLRSDGFQLDIVISIHALREEGDGSPDRSGSQPRYFYPRPPRGGRLQDAALFVPLDSISIHALREEGDIYDPEGFGQSDISIHALREEGDRSSAHRPPALRDFYPRPPRGGRLRMRSPSPASTVFLSTPSARRATRSGCRSHAAGSHFYPRPPRGGRPMVTAPSWRTSPGFLSTPSARRATGFIDLVHDLQKFLSTPSARRATKDGKSRWRPHQNFYPRPPRGGRR